MPTAWPTLADLTTKLDDLGVTAPSDGQSRLNAAIEEFERATGSRPFLGEASTVDLDLDPPGYRTGDARRLFLPYWMHDIDSVTVGRSGGSSGSTLTLGTDYFLSSTGAPYESISFASSQYGEAQSIRVNGKRGYGTTIPEMAWRAVLAYAAASVLVNDEGDVLELKVGALDIKRGSSRAMSLLDEFRAAVARYRLPRV